MRVGKRGLSPVIASVFLIVIVLVLTSLIFSWARGFVGENTTGGEISPGQSCSTLDFSVVVVSNISSNYNFEAVNYGNVDISSLKFKVYSDGDSVIVDSDVSILVGGSVAGSVILNGDIDEVEVLGVLDGKLVGKSSNVVCVDNSVYLDGI